MEDILKKISGYTGIISGYLIFLGYGFNHFYYNHFDIDFYSYANSGEIVFSFLSVFIPLILMIAVLILMYIFEEIKVKNLPITIIKSIQIKSKNKIINYIKHLFRIIIVIIGLVIFILIVFLVPISLISPFSSSLLIDPIFLIQLISVSFMIIATIYYVNFHREKSKPLALFILGSVIMIYIIFLGNTKAIAIEHAKGEYIVNMKMKNGEFRESSDQQFYLGETKNYIFLYDISNKKTESLNKDEMVSITKTRK